MASSLLNVTVTPWLLSASAVPSTCDYTAIGNAGDAAATAAGFVLANYQNRFYVFPSRGDCGWAGLAYVGYGQAWSNGYNQLSVYAHELGHNFNLLHAASLYCPGQAIGGGSCGSEEYGDPFDVMGNISAMHFNAAQKSILNWIPAASVKTHTAGSATYTLSPIESAGGTTYAVKIPAAANRTYWLEYRQPIGFDSGMSSYPNNGAQIRVSSPFEGLCTGCGDDTELLDMTPGTANNFGDGALIVGQTYVDSNYGTTISVLAANASALTVQVTAPGGSPTTTTLVSSLNPSTAGASVTFTATVTGSAPTGSVNFKDGGTSISGCTSSAVTGAGNTRTAICITSGLAAGTHTIVAAYSGDSGNAGSSSGPLSQVVNQGISTSTTALTSSLNPSTSGASVTFTATVTGTAPTGSVNFQDGGISISGCATSAVSGAGNTRTASCTTSALAVGGHSIVGSYSGDAGNAASSSVVLSQVVNNASSSSNVALASAGAVASASSVYSGSYPVAAVNDNERAGINWANGGGGWASSGGPPAWVQINFNGSKTIDRVVVYTLQDNLLNPIEPSDTLTFTQYGITDFTVQGWNGSAWVTLGSVSGNNLVKRTVSFSAFTTNQIRINVTGALYLNARIVEIEAWGN
ncbi:MAG: hypothetical protein E6H68_11760 [Betaproteobacteria bacterium]|nr:MAG: hypothetical protein E6H68_11760 [Betaproteobacteria bacterium]